MIASGALRTGSALLVLSWVSEPAHGGPGRGPQPTCSGAECPLVGRGLVASRPFPGNTHHLCEYPPQLILQPSMPLSTGPGTHGKHSVVAQGPLLPESCPDYWPTDTLFPSTYGALALTARVGPGHMPSPLHTAPAHPAHPCATLACLLGLCPARPLRPKVCAL